MDKERIEQLIALSEQILIISRNTLFVNQRFLENALGRFELVPYPGTVGTDGQCIYFHPVHIIKRYRESERLVVHDLLHMVLHCVYRHSFVALHTFKDRELWDLACDIAVEAVILELPSQGFHNERVHEKNEVLRKLREEMRVISAERVIEYLKKKAAPVEIESMTRIFKVDDHDMWYQPPKLRISIIGGG